MAELHKDISNAEFDESRYAEISEQNARRFANSIVHHLAQPPSIYARLVHETNQGANLQQEVQYRSAT